MHGPPPAPSPSAPGPADVLFLFSDTGGGHRASAQALVGALARLDPPLRAVMADPFSHDSSRLVNRLTGLYSPIIRRAPMLWGGVYHASNSRAFLNAIFASLGRLVVPSLHQLLDLHRPRLVVSVHPLLNHLAAGVLADRHPRIPLATVVTDLVSFHRGWIDPQVDLLIAPTVEAAGVCVRAGFPRDLLRVMGLPVDSRFSGPAEPAAKVALRRELGLDPGRFTVLVSGGGEGAGRLEPVVRALTDSLLPLQLLVVCGRNQELRQTLSQVPGLRGKVFGFVDHMPDLMQASDAALCKAGPGTIAESLICGLPLVLTSYLPGQEAGNVAFVTTNRAGVYAPRVNEAVRAVKAWLGEDGRPTPAHAEARSRALELSRPRASADIARTLAGMLS